MKILTVLPKYNYGDPRRGHGYEQTNFVPALVALGHDVASFDSLDTSQDVYRRGEALMASVSEFQPDAVLMCLLSYEIPIEFIRAIRHSGIRVINWFTDDSWRFESFSRFLGPELDVAATTYDWVVPKYRRAGIRGVLLTQWAASASTLTPPLPYSKCRFDVTFVGSAHGTRARWIERLSAVGIHVECFGHGWPRGVVSNDELRNVIRASKLTLNFANSSLVWDRVIPRRANQLKARVFEVPGYGGCLVTEASPGLERYYRLGEEVNAFTSFDELVTIVRTLLESPRRRDAISEAGFMRTSREHTYEGRMRELLLFAGQTNESPSGVVGIVQSSIGWRGRLLRDVLLGVCGRIWGRRGRRAARRILFELSWRLIGSSTYSMRGPLVRLFPRFPERDDF